MNRDKQRRKLIEDSVRRGLSDDDIATRVRNALDESHSSHNIFKLRREYDLLTDEEKAALLRDRRRLLIGATSAAIALVSGLGYKVLSHVEERQWAFLRRIPVSESAVPDWKDVERLYVPVGPEKALTGSAYRAAKESITDELILKGIRESGVPEAAHYELKLKQRHFMVPDEPEIVESVVRYCEKATDYLYSHPELSRLEREAITWVPVKLGDNHGVDFDKKGFIGRNMYVVQKVYASTQGEQERVVLGRPQYRAGGALRMDRDPNGSIKSWYIMIAAAEPDKVLNAPFSELIPVGMSGPSATYWKEHGEEKTILIDEALSEAISHVLATELCVKLSIPRGAEIVENGLREIQAHNIDRYKLVPNALSLVEKIGIAQAFEMYMNDPNKFEQAISR